MTHRQPHTPNLRIEAKATCHVIVNDDDNTVYASMAGPGAYDRAEAIIRSVNNHAALVEALKALATAHRLSITNNGGDAEKSGVLFHADAALKSVGEA